MTRELSLYHSPVLHLPPSVPEYVSLFCLLVRVIFIVTNVILSLESLPDLNQPQEQIYIQCDVLPTVPSYDLLTLH